MAGPGVVIIGFPPPPPPASYTFSEWAKNGLLLTDIGVNNNLPWQKEPLFYGTCAAAAFIATWIALMIIGGLAQGNIITGPATTGALLGLGITATVLALTTGGFKQPIVWVALVVPVVIVILASLGVANVLSTNTIGMSIELSLVIFKGSGFIGLGIYRCVSD